MQAMADLTADLRSEWKSLLNDEFKKPYFLELSAFIKSEIGKGLDIFPEPQNILRIFKESTLGDIKVVILGQDPYHGPGQAIGKSFAVPDKLRPKPPSLKNIYKEIEADLDTKIDFDKSNLDGWSEQGVFLLNSVLTVRANEANSHRGKGWETFTDKVIQLLNSRTKGMVFLLWGSAAQSKDTLITAPQHFVLKAPHPSPLSAYRGFLGCRHFSQTNQILHERLGQAPINWTRTH